MWNVNRANLLWLQYVTSQYNSNWLTCRNFSRRRVMSISSRKVGRHKIIANTFGKPPLPGYTITSCGHAKSEQVYFEMSTRRSFLHNSSIRRRRRFDLKTAARRRLSSVIRWLFNFSRSDVRIFNEKHCDSAAPPRVDRPKMCQSAINHEKLFTRARARMRERSARCRIFFSESRGDSQSELIRLGLNVDNGARYV
jgi:hypothetical protein